MKNLKIEYNEKILNYVKEYDLFNDVVGSVLFVLFALDEKRYDLLDEFDDRNKQRRVVILYRQMERRGLIQSSTDGYFYELSKEGKSLVDKVRAEFKPEVHAADFVELVQNIEKKSIQNKNEIRAWIQEYLESFPKDKRDNATVCTERMEEFIKKFNYDKSVIIGGAKLYNDYHTKVGTDPQYRRRAQYLIYYGHGKGRTWDLATWCDKFKEQQNEPQIDSSVFDIV